MRARDTINKVLSDHHRCDNVDNLGVHQVDDDMNKIKTRKKLLLFQQ